MSRRVMSINRHIPVNLIPNKGVLVVYGRVRVTLWYMANDVKIVNSSLYVWCVKNTWLHHFPECHQTFYHSLGCIWSVWHSGLLSLIIAHGIHDAPGLWWEWPIWCQSQSIGMRKPERSFPFVWHYTKALYQQLSVRGIIYNHRLRI